MKYTYAKEQRWALRYISKIDGTERVCYPQSEQKKNEQLDLCKQKGITVLSCKKLYPFSTEKNQHNFDLIHSICMNAMHDMETGEAEWNSTEYDRLEAMKEKAEKFIAWIEQLKVDRE